MTTKLRKLSLWTAMVGLGFFVFGFPVPALFVRIVTECLRMPSFHAEGMHDQVKLSAFVLVACSFGVVRYLTQ